MFVRKFEKDEWPIYKAIRLEALSFHEDVYGGSLKDEARWADAIWANMFGHENYAFFGLYDGQQIVGITCVFADRNDLSGRTALLAGSYIRESHRGKGYSSLLYEERIGWIKQSGYFDRIIVGHKQGNEASRRANQHYGFRPTGQEEKSWGDGSKGIIYHYELRL